MAANTTEERLVSDPDTISPRTTERVAPAPLQHTDAHTRTPAQLSPSVHFSSAVEEIAPDQAQLEPAPSVQEPGSHVPLGDPGEFTPDQIKAIARSLKTACPLQERRMGIFSYEPYSLPVSRTASNDEGSNEPSRQGTRSPAGHHSPHLSPRPDMTTPPLTPAGTAAADHEGRGRQRPEIISPQEYSQDPSLQHGPSDHRKGLFAIGPSRGSPTSTAAPSRESSPTRVTASQLYSRPLTPAGEINDPYAASKRTPLNKIEPRFVFSRDRKKHHVSPGSSSANLSRGSGESKRAGLFAGHHHHHDDGAPNRTGSMAELKRFLRFGKDHHNKVKRTASPAASIRSGTRTPPSNSSRAPGQIPFGDDHGLTSKYGKFGKVLGSGAGGAVRLMKRGDGVVFAAKEFRARHAYETEREYVKKLTAEYCIGSSLHHGNVIETLDIVQDKGKWYEVMEYAPFDLFAIVMTGKMSREEISCCFLQMLNGVTYLHSMGLAHRDMKLDNVVVSERGILKIIDFGSAHVFRYPFESGMVLASGIVGSDPYLAPEVYDAGKYDPTAVDIWSLAIIYCCMSLRRFPWKQPRLTDNSYKMFAADPSPGHDPHKLILPYHARSMNDLQATAPRDIDFEDERKKSVAAAQNAQRQEESRKADASPPEKAKQPAAPAQGEGGKPAAGTGEKKEQIRGPWRILRLLPRESRHVISRMLEIDPKKRAKMEEILADDWVANTVICRQEASDLVINANDHTHILKPPAEYTGGPSK